MVMDRNLLLAPALLGDLRFQVSLLRLMYPKTDPNSGACVQVAELERLQQPARAMLVVKPAS
jgi:hypothetical protein